MPNLKPPWVEGDPLGIPHELKVMPEAASVKVSATLFIWAHADGSTTNVSAKHSLSHLKVSVGLTCRRQGAEEVRGGSHLGRLLTRSSCSARRGQRRIPGLDP